jgi:putative PIN family toxin of toxin-antitoxin system|tara:strand:+ start:3680 stop:4120 length:441 start_codon:yes stop_codon:yes gene_type:complete
MRIVADTNVLYQALRDQGGASHYILQLVKQSAVEKAVSVPVFLEYRDVLLRLKILHDLKFTVEEIETVLRFIAYIAKAAQIHFLMRSHLRDESDNMVVDLAFASNSEFIVTNNVRDFQHKAESTFGGFAVVTSSEFVKQWRTHHGD